MSRFVSSTVSSQKSGNNTFIFAIETSVSDRTVSATFKVYAKGSFAPYAG
jgi:hypothetical protein